MEQETAKRTRTSQRGEAEEGTGGSDAHHDAKEAPQKRQRTAASSGGGVPSSGRLVREAGDDMLLLLAKTRVEELAPDQQVKFITREEPMHEAFRMLLENGILSAPVLDKSHHFHGFIDMLDFAQFVVDQFGDRSVQSMEDVQSLMSDAGKWLEPQASSIMRHTHVKNKTLLKGYSLLHAAEVLAWSGAHRYPVEDSSNRVCHIITQSMLIDFIWSNIEALGEKRHITVAHMRLPPSTVISVPTNMRTLDAFNLMIKKGVSGLPVVNEDGALVDNISIRDLRGIKYDAKILWRLWEAVHFFKQRLIKEDQRAPTSVVYVLETDTLETVVRKMAENRIHRVFVVDDEQHMRPRRVLSQCDVLQNVLPM